jgi:hypothetical protein
LKKSIRLISLFLAVITALGVFLPLGFADEQPGAFSYEISNGKATIGGYSGTESDLVIPEKVKDESTGEYCDVTKVKFIDFNDEPGFASISFPKTVTEIVFDNDILCGAFIVDGENTKYLSDDGVLFTKDMAVLIKYPCLSERKTYTVPADVIIVESEAFKNSVNLEKVSFDGFVRRIGSEAFSGCKNLKSVENLPAGFDTVGGNAFEGCEGLLSSTGIALSEFGGFKGFIVDLRKNAHGVGNVLASILNKFFGSKNKAGGKNKK